MADHHSCLSGAKVNADARGGRLGIHYTGRPGGKPGLARRRGGFEGEGPIHMPS